MSTGVRAGASRSGQAAADRSRDVVIFGGTFDPVHDGHLAVARAVCAAAEPDVFLFMPSALPPHRATPAVTAEHRLAMLQQAIAGHPHWQVDDCELRRAARGEASYTVATLREKHAAASDERYTLVLGWDAFLGLPQWREPEAILQLCRVIVLPRAGTDRSSTSMTADHPLAARWQQRRTLDASQLRTAPAGSLLECAMPAHPASATAIRAALAAGEQHPAHVPPAVADYIERHRLYRWNAHAN